MRKRRAAAADEPPAGARRRRDQAPGEPSKAALATPHELYALRHPRPRFVVVVPSYGRPERLQTLTLALLRRQGIPGKNIQVWLAPGRAPGQDVSELTRYQDALKNDWPDIRLKVGVRGIMEQRWFIANTFPEGTHVLSLDDDVEELLVKTPAGNLEPLPRNALEAIVHHAKDLMLQEGAFIWGLSASSCPLNMLAEHISRKNGVVNGFMYGYLVRHDPALQSILCSPTEDVERSCRFFAKDGVVLRYGMYCGKTTFKAENGISLLHPDATERKAVEDSAIEELESEFPELIMFRRGEQRRKTDKAMNFRFRSVGQGPLRPDGSAKSAGPAADAARADAAGADADAARAGGGPARGTSSGRLHARPTPAPVQSMLGLQVRLIRTLVASVVGLQRVARERTDRLRRRASRLANIVVEIQD